MKNSICILLFVLAISQIQAQDYLVNFTGTGDTNSVTTVIVENLTSGAIATLDGTDTLHLSSTVGIGGPPVAAGSLLLYPNPMTVESMLTFSVPENGVVIITLNDLTGHPICKLSQYVKKGTNSFSISGICPGLYFVIVRGEYYRFASKLLCQTGMETEPRIGYLSSAVNTCKKPLKSTAAQVNMPYENGDQLLFMGMTGIYSTLVADVSASSKTITFDFAACTDADNTHSPLYTSGPIPGWLRTSMLACVLRAI
jgi:hypothetical protein